MPAKAILVVSFGTSYDETRKKTILATEEHVAKRFPDFRIYSAYTSGMIRASLQRRGIYVPSVSEALDKIADDGVTILAVQPTHLIYGEEYEKMYSAVLKKAECFEMVSVAAPLLSDFDDMEKVLSVLSVSIQRTPDEALVLMGHGSEHYSNMAYAAMDYYAKTKGFNHVFIGTVESFPDLEEVLGQVIKNGFKKAILTPLMLVAGDHAQNDMAGDEPDSWLSVFRENGIETGYVLRGLGEYEDIREVYCEHIEKALGYEL